MPLPQRAAQRNLSWKDVAPTLGQRRWPSVETTSFVTSGEVWLTKKLDCQADGQLTFQMVETRQWEPGGYTRGPSLRAAAALSPARVFCGSESRSAISEK